MSLTIVLRSSDSSLPEGLAALTFDGGRVVIGRGAGCDVRLPDRSVSARHAMVRVKGSEYSLVAEKTMNGTFAGGTKLAPGTPHTLKSGDLVRVGRVWLEVRIDQAPATRDPAAATRDLALALVSQGMRAVGQDAGTKVHVVEGRDAGEVLPLEDEGRAYVVGRGSRCDLPLSEADAQVYVTRRGGTVLVREVGSTSGAWLGDAPVPTDRDAHWRSASPLRVGASTLVLEEPAAVALAELEAAADQPMAPEDVPPEPSPAAPAPVALKAPSRPDLGPPLARAPLAKTRRDRWSPTDVAVLLAALSILGLSIVGLVWLLRM